MDNSDNLDTLTVHEVNQSKVQSKLEIIGRKKLSDSQFEENVKKRDGFILHKPADWL
ncbi:MAG: hypothetical protein Q8T08_00065 [Ignavibacteria bacterium]|nr:hypothetical protein [Ignavibacteria bacterium]